ncbi:MAG: acyl-homoserine-lactone synthase [Pelagimonas sp.]|uniref:acyl-homoserine-lactone synthase n=1 Tax=Pelagimonas sp. TaxID=2073170 RepID=UPI003D6A3505
MIIVVDGLNRDRYTRLLDEMFELRARVFGKRLGWEVDIKDGKEIDQFDALDPAYVIGLNDDGRVVSCVRALQTTGPHMLSDVFSAILDGEQPLRSPTLWESTRFCVDTERLDRGKSRNSVAYATCELMAASLEYAQESGISDIVTVIDPIMDRVLKRSDCAPYGYVGKTTPMGKVPAMAALLDCSDERISKIRGFAGISGDVFIDAEQAEALADPVAPEFDPSLMDAIRSARPIATLDTQGMLEQYCDDQASAAKSRDELQAANRLAGVLFEEGMITRQRPKFFVC